MVQGDHPSSSSTLDVPSLPAPVPESVPAAGDDQEAARSEHPPVDAAADRQPFRLGNRPALTGIRAVGITAVLVYHSTFRVLPGAWAMLGVFFVLSGFLITTMLVSERQKTGTMSLRRFYSRRAVRLLPPLFITVVLLAIYASVVSVADAADHIWGDVAGATFYYADYRSALGHESAFGFLAQSWSLAVEEQFYLIWAVLLFVCLRYGTRRMAYALALIGLAVSVADRLWIVLRSPVWNTQVSGRVYYAFDTRADALFLGCLLGLVATGGHLNGWRLRSKRILALLAAASAAAMVWILCTVDVTARSLPLYWLPVSEVASAVIIIYFLIHPDSLSTRAMGIPILVFIGNMSYAIYLFHWPVYVAISPFSVKWPFWLEETVRLAIIGVLAAASWHFVEQPLMRWRKRNYEAAMVTAPPAAPIPSVDTAPKAELPPMTGGGPVPIRPRPIHSAVMAVDLLDPVGSGPSGPGMEGAGSPRDGPDRRPPRRATHSLTATGLLAAPDAVGAPDAPGPTVADC